MNNTEDLSKFGAREFDILIDLIKAFRNGDWEGENIFGSGVTYQFNPNSGNVFLTDDDYNVAMFNGDDKLEVYLYCGDCGKEGFPSEEPTLKKFYEEGACSECIADPEKLT